MLTINRTFRCGHTVEVRIWQQADETRDQKMTFRCDACQESAKLPAWEREGYESPAAYRAAVKHEREARKAEREREARMQSPEFAAVLASGDRLTQALSAGRIAADRNA